jgi:fermentation-respiration switch protein FrsA (DUF1100 family)
MEIFFDLLTIAFLFLINATFVLLVTGPLILLKPSRRKPEWYARFTDLLEPNHAGLPQENLTVNTFDGFKLNCWFVAHKQKAKGTIVYLHGVGDCKIDGVPFARALFDRGFNIFLYDSRAHGESEGSYCTYGFYEKYDTATVITYLLSRTDVRVGKIGVFGTSMGGAVAIQAAAIDSRIAAVATEGSFTALRTIFVDYQKRIIKLPWHFLRNIALMHSQRIAGFKARLVSPLEDVKKVHVPILIIHGEYDSFIKPEYAQKLFEAAREPKQQLIVAGADHTTVWKIGGAQYAETLGNFFEKNLTE